MSGVAPAGHGWCVVVPVKSMPTAKSRLRLPGPLRTRVARAMALDTVAAAARCAVVAGVVVVTDAPADEVSLLGARVVPDGPRAGLNAALAWGAEAGLRSSDRAVGVAALTADLPALLPAELAAALHAVPVTGRAVVADAGGTGTTLLAAAPGNALQPAFGPQSYRRHRETGAVDVTAAAGPGLRRDVDTLADLRAAAARGLGRYTAELLPDLSPWLQSAPDRPAS